MAGKERRNILITGGAGFIGSNLAARLLLDPRAHVRIFDNLSRRGVIHNVRWLKSHASSDRLEIVRGDVRNFAALQAAAADVSEIYHLAAQVAVTTSLADPREDFEVNSGGTFNMLEAARRSRRRPFVLFTSTNKVYGSLKSVPVVVEGTRYRAKDAAFRGVDESECLDFHSPYGCSKGAADQYVRDYGRIYDLPTVVFRMSCIAGQRQFGNEDQGWVAHFLYSVLSGKEITIYGDGFQVRDVLHVDDLLDAMIAAREAAGAPHGQIYNVGGGMERATSVIEMLEAIARQTRKPLRVSYSSVRSGDQPLYVSNTAKLERETGWRARRSLDKTLQSIHGFWRQSLSQISAEDPSSGESELVGREVA